MKIHGICLLILLALLNTHGKQTRTAINAKKVFSTVVAEYNIKSFGLYDKSALAAWHWSGGAGDDDADRRRCGGGGGASHVGIGAHTHTESVATLASTAARLVLPASCSRSLSHSRPHRRRARLLRPRMATP